MQAVCMITVILLCCAQEAGGIWNAPLCQIKKSLKKSCVKICFCKLFIYFYKKYCTSIYRLFNKLTFVTLIFKVKTIAYAY